jgi:hypothetical protein
MLPMEKVTVPAETVKSAHDETEDDAVVTVYVATLSKIALSDDVGTDAPPVPPDVVDQLAVEAQLPLPLIQYLSAIDHS